MILAAVTDERLASGSCSHCHPLVFVGKISYALYLWHPIIIWGFHRLPVTAEVALAILIATLSYYFVELPFLRLKRKDRARIDSQNEPTAARIRPTAVPSPPAG